SYAAAWGLPATFTEPGCRIIVYVAEDMPGLLAWLDSPELRAAIEDGTEREAQVVPVDGDPFTGNIYAVREVRNEIGTEFPPDRRDQGTDVGAEPRRSRTFSLRPLCLERQSDALRRLRGGRRRARPARKRRSVGYDRRFRSLGSAASVRAQRDRGTAGRSLS